MSLNTLTFRHTGTTGKGKYTAEAPGVDEVAEVTYSRVNASTVIVDHTEVPESLRGQGIGLALVEHVVSEARREGFRLVPLCPFFKSQLDRHPEWRDVID